MVELIYLYFGNRVTSRVNINFTQNNVTKRTFPKKKKIKRRKKERYISIYRKYIVLKTIFKATQVLQILP